MFTCLCPLPNSISFSRKQEVKTSFEWFLLQEAVNGGLNVLFSGECNITS